MVGFAITISICVTLTVWFVISAKIFYDLRLNKEFTVKAKNISSLLDAFKNTYVDGWGKDTKYIGKGIDIKNLLEQIQRILYNK